MNQSTNITTRLNLGFWLGPWAPRNRVPSGVKYEKLQITSGAPHSRLYTPTRKTPNKAWIVSPGFHSSGPAEPRIHRFANILAQTGAVVFVPALNDNMNLNFRPSAIDDFRDAFDCFSQRPEVFGKDIAIFAPSAGSLTAFHLAADSQRAARIDRLLCFGAYVDPYAVFYHLIHGDSDMPHLRDPLNQPIAFLTLVADLPGCPNDTTALCQAWRSYIRTVWPDPKYKEAGSTKHHAVATHIAATLPKQDRELFLVGCDVHSGAWALAKEALDNNPQNYEFLDPRPSLPKMQARVCAMHSHGDAVIPFSQLDLLRVARPNATFCPLQSYAHASALTLPKLLQKGPGVLRDLVALKTIADFICD